ncbi:MAG: site-specific DNA-methyltransferase [Deltaproteobacteria bacterium]|nr:MAG: site-specific DNA-methyltransferase [Deltaproteobacteria bacterium]
MAKKTTLELTWIGKDKRPRLEPRILLEDPELSYAADHRVSENDIFDNMLIQGDNLLALKALEHDFAGKVKCIFIDPPYNTGVAFSQYDDGVEHSIWLSLMRDRLQLLRRLLARDGSLWITIDDNEAHYLKVLCDEVFGRFNFVCNAMWQKKYTVANDAKWLSENHDHVLVYAADKVAWRPYRLPRTAEMDKRYRNPDNHPKGPWKATPLYAKRKGSEREQAFTYEFQNGVVWTAPPGTSPRFPAERLRQMDENDEIWFGVNGNATPARKTFLSELTVEGPPSPTVWLYGDVGHNHEARDESKVFNSDDPFATPKPERLLKRVLQLATRPGDLVLDSFLGSGTTAAVAHKMGRRWIGVELGAHARTHCLPRLRAVMDGSDGGGVSDKVGWKGGGGFRFYRLAPSLLEEDKWGNWVINRAYNKEMLAEAMCKIEGFRYEPSPSIFWMHGQSTETDYIYVTTQTLTHEQLQVISAEVGDERTLLICCSAFRARLDQFPNLTVKKIPAAVLARCEWGKDDYSLNVQTVMGEEPQEPEPEPEESTDDNALPSPSKKRKGRKPKVQELPMFPAASKEGDQ